MVDGVAGAPAVGFGRVMVVRDSEIGLLVDIGVGDEPLFGIWG